MRDTPPKVALAPSVPYRTYETDETNDAASPTLANRPRLTIFPPKMPDQIVVQALELTTHIGVPDEERVAPQRLTLNLTLEPARDFRNLKDDITQTVDYYAVSKALQARARERPRKLIETLAEEIAAFVLKQFPVRAVELELRKYILPDTAFVAVRVRRERE